MFRKTSQIYRIIIQNFGSGKWTFFGGTAISGAAVALSSDELKKQPLWYQTAVRKLSFAIKHTNRKGYLDDVLLLENLRQKLLPYSDSTNTDILWRYARVLLEIGLWTSSADKNRMQTFLEAERIAKKAIDNEIQSSPCAEAHKWYGIILVKLGDFRSDKKLDEARKHLERAVELDPNDVRSWQYLGIVQYMQKEYKAAVESHQKAESLQPGFSNENKFWLGKAQLALRQKKDACETFLQGKSVVPHYRNEFKVAVQIRELLLKKCGMRMDRIPDSTYPF